MDLQFTFAFGGKTVVLGEDFCQILPVILRALREDIVNATINPSNLWSHCKVLKLTKNIRLQAINSSSVAPKLKLFLVHRKETKKKQKEKHSNHNVSPSMRLASSSYGSDHVSMRRPLMAPCLAKKSAHVFASPRTTEKYTHQFHITNS